MPFFALLEVHEPPVNNLCVSRFLSTVFIFSLFNFFFDFSVLTTEHYCCRQGLDIL